MSKDKCSDTTDLSSASLIRCIIADFVSNFMYMMYFIYFCILLRCILFVTLYEHSELGDRYKLGNIGLYVKVDGVPIVYNRHIIVV